MAFVGVLRYVRIHILHLCTCLCACSRCMDGGHTHMCIHTYVYTYVYTYVPTLQKHVHNHAVSVVFTMSKFTGDVRMILVMSCVCISVGCSIRAMLLLLDCKEKILSMPPSKSSVEEGQNGHLANMSVSVSVCVCVCVCAHACTYIVC